MRLTLSDDTGTVKGKGKEKKEVGRQTTLFGLPPAQPADKKASAPARKKKGTPNGGSQEQEPSLATEQDTQIDSQADVVMEDGQPESLVGGDTQVDDEPTQLEETQVDGDDVGDLSSYAHGLLADDE